MSHRPDPATLVWRDDTEGVDWHELEALYRAAPLGTKRAEDLRTVYGNSRYACIVRDAEGRLAGAGRVLSDGLDCAYVCDVALLPAWQGGGVGQALVQRLVDRCRGHRKIILYAVPGKEPFYRRFGFRRMRTAMAIFEHPAQAAQGGYIDAE